MTRFDPPDIDAAPTLPSDPRPPSLPVRITREVAVPIVAIVYLGVMSVLRFYDKLGEVAFVASVLTPVAGYIGSIVPKLQQDKNR